MHPQFCIPEEQTIIYSQLLSLKIMVGHGSVSCPLETTCEILVTSTQFFGHIGDKEGTIFGPWPLKQNTSREGGVDTEAV